NPKPVNSSLLVFLNPHQALTLIADNQGGSTCRNPGSTWQESTLTLIFNTARPVKIIPQSLFEDFREDYWVFSNGTTCTRNGETIFHISMKNIHMESILRKLHIEYPSYFFSVEVQGQIFTSSACAKTNQKYFADFMELESVIIQDINKIIVIAENRDFPVEELKEGLNPELKLLITEKGKYIQIMPVTVSKLSAVEHILGNLNMSISHVLSFGDDLNDLELIKASGIGVAMHNAYSELKSCADYITSSNDQDGIRVFIERMLLPHAYFSRCKK
ncbi:HAD hydrolase family protein, partial [Terrimonas pollutisoli]|uniref:HAD hydrolase family protein n=1 Tax=Terrimonas pollutisoli TaxID=3034147 RepID=UPI0023EB7E7A